MKATQASKKTGYLIIGGGVTLLSAAYVALALQLPMGGLSNPGAAVFPLMVGGLLFFSGLAAVWEGWKMERSEKVDFPVSYDLARLLALLGLLVAYVLTMPWLGQLPASILFTALLMKVISLKTPIWQVAVWSVVLMLPFYYLFVIVLRVPMPRGFLM